jgi:ubiquinone/menaquinone biosynthesis C-methylase UbiE
MAEMHPIEKILVNSRIYNFFYRHTLLREFLDFCDLKGECLEIGCGKGVTSKELYRKFAVSLSATDYDDEEVRLAKKNLKDTPVKVMQADATALPFNNQGFDAAVEMNTLHHIENYQDAIKEIYRVLKKGGNFFMLDIGRHWMWPLSLLFSAIEPFQGKFTKESMLKDLEKAGFKIIKQRGGDVFMIQARK